MTSYGTDLSGRNLLAIFSHPDDESLACGGLLACCAEYGAQVTLVCATGGELGPRGHVVPWAPSRLRDARARELAEAAQALGIANVVLLDHVDGFLPWVDAAQLEAELVDVIVRVRPDVVITFGADGLYWHPDHIAIHHRTTAAVASLEEDGPVLYYVTMPHGRMRAIAESIEPEAGQPAAPLFGSINPDAFGLHAAPPTLIVDVATFAGRKLAALRCHRTQLATGPVALMSEADAARLLGTEHFHRATVGSAAPSFIEQFAAGAPIEAS